MFRDVGVAVTGSSGFLGSHLVRKLVEQSVRVVEIDLEKGTDLTDWGQIENLSNISVVFHLAGKTYVPSAFQEPRAFYHANILGTLNALEVCRRKRAKIVFISAYVYGIPRYLPIDENHPLQATNPYSESKLIGEQLCQAYHRDFGLSGVILRLFNVYGPGQRGDFLIPSILMQAGTGNIVLKDSSPERDFVYIDDVVDACVRAWRYDSEDMEVFNIGFGESYSVARVVEEVARHFGRNVEIRYTGEKRPNEVPVTVADIGKARKALEWEPKIGFAEGIRHCIENI